MQKEFINIAAHELKTPIQPILGITQILRSQIQDAKQQELLEITIRNAKRLQHSIAVCVHEYCMVRTFYP
ncbi:MAG: histidine kinase dimerization/phospho-acceptor domain-containing protein [Candidatus Nitrosopolaris sp.]